MGIWFTPLAFMAPPFELTARERPALDDWVFRPVRGYPVASRRSGSRARRRWKRARAAGRAR